jgi:L1 cell adhesion molecule like protein
MVPSVVRLCSIENDLQSHRFVVGAEAVKLAETAKDEESTGYNALISSIKRLFGKRYEELDSTLLESLPFHIEEGENESIRLVIPVIAADPSNTVLIVETNPLEIASILLKAIREATQQYLDKYQRKKNLQIPGERAIRNVVVGVPAHFSKRHIKLVEEACRKAGFDGHVSTCLESTAAAMAYGLTMQENSRNASIMVIDMGGGTTDITIAQKNKTTNVKAEENCSSYKVLVTQGDEHLGGDDIDQALMEYCCQQVEGIELQGSEWLPACRNAKESLCHPSSPSSMETISIGDHSVLLSQDQFKKLLDIWLMKARNLIKLALAEFKKTNASKKYISEVILVGGTTRVPAIRDMIKSVFPELELCTSLNPMSSVAQGLAIQAAIQSKLVPLHELKSALMLDCVPHAIGVELPNGDFCEIIPRNAPLPARGSATFHLAGKEQQGVTIRAVEQITTSDHLTKYEPMAKEDFTFLLRRLSPQELKQVSLRSIEVGMKIDEEGRFVVSIFDESDLEQVRKRERLQKLSSDEVIGELNYIADLVMAESGTTMEQFLLLGTLIGVFILYIAVKMAFNDPEARSNFL